MAIFVTLIISIVSSIIGAYIYDKIKAYKQK